MLAIITELLGVPVHCQWADYTEWVLPETTVERLAPELKNRLKALGCTVINVDSTKPPYYFVAVRIKQYGIPAVFAHPV